MTESESSLVVSALAWVEGDPDPETARELSALVESANFGELEERFARPLTFGTAGLRGLVGSGPGRMNIAVVIRTTKALAEHLLATNPDARTLPVVIGCDARHSSRAFADAAIGVLAAMRIPVRHFEGAVPTPLVAYAVRALAATAGIVVTASHNPAAYNGYKLYGANGVQIVPPTDAEVERRVEAVGAARAVAVAPRASSLWNTYATPVPASLTERYLSEIDAARPRGVADRGLSIVYTPLHGVGGELVLESLSRAGFSDVAVVEEQFAPDGDFPTVRFPNPEQPGVLERALSLAKERGADLVLANDPDADRLAVAVPTAAGRFVVLSGNEIGLLLADFVLAHAPAAPTPLVLSTIVSSPMVLAMAQARGARVETTLTGFKWLWSAALDLEKAGNLRFAFAFEEALGFSISKAVRDKDGIGAALVFAELAAQCRARGESVLERLRGLYARHCLWTSVQRSFERPGLLGAREISGAVAKLVEAPPSVIAGHEVTAVVDYRKGADTRSPWLPATPLVLVDLGAHGRILLRPSGTEPKLKVYVDLRSEAPSPGAFDAAEAALRAEASRAATELAKILGFD